MLHIFRINSYIDDAAIGALINDMSELEAEDTLKVIIRTIGGDMHTAEAIADILNQDVITNVYFESRADSAGLTLFSNIDPKKVTYSDNLTSTQHLCRISVSTTDTINKRNGYLSQKKILDPLNKKFIETMEHVVSEEDLDEIRKGEDIIMTLPQILLYRDIVNGTADISKIENKSRILKKIVYENEGKCICQVKTCKSYCPCKLDECICGLFNETAKKQTESQIWLKML